MSDSRPLLPPVDEQARSVSGRLCGGLSPHAACARGRERLPVLDLEEALLLRLCHPGKVPIPILSSQRKRTSFNERERGSSKTTGILAVMPADYLTTHRPNLDGNKLKFKLRPHALQRPRRQLRSRHKSSGLQATLRPSTQHLPRRHTGAEASVSDAPPA